MTGDPTFPPLINGVSVAPGSDPFDAACRAAADGKAEAGDFYWSPSKMTLSVALVVEPEVSAPAAMDMLFAAMVAFGDAVGALAPPEVGITYKWPQELLANGARVGTACIRMSPDAGPEGIPEWMVISLSAEIGSDEGMTEPGLYIDRTTLWDEGCGEITRTQLLESFARHLKTWIHTWEMDGSRPIRENWLARAVRPGEEVTFQTAGEARSGVFLGLDEAGNMLVRIADTTIVADLAASLQPDPFSPPGEAAS